MVTSKKPAAKKAAPAPKKLSVSARKDGRTKVFWKPAEHEQLAHAAALSMQQGFRGQHRALLISVQSVLPEARRRFPGSMRDEAWFQPALDKALADLHQAEVDKAAADAKAQEPAPVVEAPTPSPEPIARAVAPNEAVAAGIGHAMLNLRALLVDELAAVIVEAALKALGSGLLSGGTAASIELAPNNGNGTQRVVFHRPPSGPRKLALLVVGLKGAQKTEIHREFAERFDLRFVGADESKDALRAQAERAEKTVAMTDFISHSHEDIIKARSPHYIRQPGGMTQLRSTLAGLLQ